MVADTVTFNFKPMLGAACDDLAKLRYPMLGSPKLDGVRAVMTGQGLVSRALKPIPNRRLQAQARKLIPVGYDGELIAGSPTDPRAFNNTTRAVMSESGMPRVTFYVFDKIANQGETFVEREAQLKSHGALVQRVPQTWLHGFDYASRFEGDCIDAGYEGIILRNPQSPYKFGRSTLNEQGLVKVKRFKDDEAVVTGMEELMHNDNPATVNELGRTARSSHQANQRGGGKLGALVVKWQGKQFKIGSGFLDSERVDFWKQRGNLIGQQVKFKYLPVGMKDLPRHPIFLGWRDGRDG